MKTLRRAARQPLAIAVLLASLASGLTIALWLLPVGLAAYLAIVALSARGQRIAGQAVQPLPRPAPAFQQQIERIERTSRTIDQLIAGADGALQRLLMPIGEQARTLVVNAYGLAEKAAIIDQFCSATQPQALRQQIAAVDARLAGTADHYTRQQLESTRAALLEQEENIAALTTYRERIVAQLANVAANLDKVYTDTLRLRAAQVTDVTSISGQIAEQLNNLNADVDAFQHVLEGAMGQVGAS